MYEAIKRKQALASYLRQQGFALAEKEEWQAAIQAHAEARKINEELGDIGAAAGDVTNTAIIYERMGDMEKAEQFHLEAAAMDEGINYNQGLRIDYSNLSRFYASKGSIEKALEYHQKLIDVNLALGDISGVARLYRDRGFMLHHLGRSEDALACHQKARELNQLASDIVAEAGDITNIAAIHEKQGEYEKALELNLEAAALDEKARDAEGLRIDYTNLARLYARLGNLEKAREFQGKLTQVLSQSMPALRAFSLNARGIKGSLRLVKEEAGAYTVSYDVPSPVRQKIQYYPIQISDNRLEDVNRRISRLTDKVNRAKAMRGLSDTEEKKEVKTQIASELTELGKVLYSITLPSQVKRIYQKLQNLGAIEIGVSESLVGYPWELMHDGTDFICLNNNIGRYIIVDTLDEVPNIRATTKDKLRVLIVGDPCGSGETPYVSPFSHLGALPGARKEAIQLALYLERLENVEVKVFVGEEINTVRLLSELSSDYDFIHYTGHAIFAEADPMESGLLLHDGIVRAYEIMQCIGSQKQPPMLAFINACESGMETDWGREVKYTNQVFGMASAFLKCGVNYIGSLWPLHDDPAIEIALQFYASVLNGNGFGESLRNARKMSYTKYGQDEIAWASYVLYGDPTLMLKDSHQDAAAMKLIVEEYLEQRLFGLER